MSLAVDPGQNTNVGGGRHRRGPSGHSMMHPREGREADLEQGTDSVETDVTGTPLRNMWKITKRLRNHPSQHWFEYQIWTGLEI